MKGLLPPGKVSQEEASGTDGGARALPPHADVVLDDGHGAAVISIGFTRYAPGGGTDFAACPDATLVPVDACTASTLADGSTLVLLQGYEYPDRHVPTKRWDAMLLHPDGGLVTLTEWNAPAEKDAAVTRDEPPLTLAQLTAVVGDPKAWDPVLAGLPAPAPVTEQRLGMTRQEMITVLPTLLPAGLSTAGADGQDGYTHLTVDDGKGASLVEVNADDLGRRDADPQALLGPGDVSVLPDGSHLVVNRNADSGGKGGSGIVRWTVAVVRPDGTRVVVAATNSAAARLNATRATPALTVEQMQAIATSPAWHLHPITSTH
ncbi:hypothetical protein GCM10009665_53300 [Kitasatospora nipponensis]|uniref:Uncharacterized protein n=1 Tax=Kitasatospora nipponensis TaxID=258049 RepID=A0ABP4HA98_9ACTN